MAMVQISGGSSRGRTLRLQTLIRLRWLAVAGQSVAVLFVHLWLSFPLPVSACAVLIGSLVWLNLFLTFRFPSAHRLKPGTAFALLLTDLVQVTALLFITGGLANPFAPLVCVPVIISSACSRSRTASCWPCSPFSA